MPVVKPKTSSPTLGDITLAENLSLDDTLVRERHLKHERDAFEEAFEGFQCNGDPSTWLPPRKVLIDDEERTRMRRRWKREDQNTGARRREKERVRRWR
jgi:hypothetical protein